MSSVLWKFSDQLDDADRIMIQKDFITLNDGVEYYGLGMKPFTRIAERLAPSIRSEKWSGSEGTFWKSIFDRSKR